MEMGGAWAQGRGAEIDKNYYTPTWSGAGLRLGPVRGVRMPPGRGLGAEGVPLPGFGAGQDSQDVCLFVAGHTFQAAALDQGPSVWLPFKRVTHILVEFRTAGGW